MDRRKALRNMGMAMGYTVATPTLIGLMQGCKTEKVLEWTPDFFTKDQGAVVHQLVDIFLPQTDTPSASEMQVHLFIYRFADQALEKEQQEFMKMAMDKFIEKAIADAGVERAVDLSPENLEALLSNTLRISKEEEEAHEEAVTEYMETIAEGGSGSLDDATARYAFANNLRNMTIWGYKTSEYVGEEVLRYLPVPGKYVACGSVQELTGGKDWSM